MVTFNATNTNCPGDIRTIVDLFEEQVERTPENIAVVCKEVSLTYKALNAEANQLAHYFLKKKIGREDKVIFLLNRGTNYLASMLAVWKVGACFIPLDPEAPISRNSRIVSQIDYSFILTTANPLETLDEFEKDRLIFIEDALQEAPVYENLCISLSPANLSYIIFTSGSTGVPKGVMVEHLGMLNHLYAKLNDFKITENDNIAQTATQVFDVSVWQFVVALLAGARTTVLIGEDAWSPEKLIENINRYGLTILESVPAHFSFLRFVT